MVISDLGVYGLLRWRGEAAEAQERGGYEENTLSKRFPTLQIQQHEREIKR